MELQYLVKVKVRTLDDDADPVQVTVAAVDGRISTEQVYKKITESLGLKTSSRPFFTLLEKRDKPVRRYKQSDQIDVANADLCLFKWCFDISEEKELVHNDPIAAHLIFLQAQHDVHSGKFNFTQDDRQKLEDCLEPGFMAINQYILICQKQPYYHGIQFPQCRLLQHLSVSPVMLTADSLLDVIVTKYGVKLLAEKVVTITWFEVLKWTLNKGERIIKLTYLPEENALSNTLSLQTEQAELMLAVILEQIKILQKTDKSEASFHADMITVTPDGTTVWENGLYNPSKAKRLQPVE